MKIDLSQFPIADIAEIQRSLCIEQAFFVPGPSSEDDLTPTTAEIAYSTDNCIGGEVYITPKYSECRTSVLFTGHEFLAIMAFLVDEGLLVACAGDEAAPGGDQPGADDPPPAGEPGFGDDEPAKLLSVALLEDQDWLHQKHVVEGLSMAEMGRLVGRHGTTVKARLIKYGIELHRRQGYRATTDEASHDQDLPEPGTESPTTEARKHASAIMARVPPAPWLEDIVNDDQDEGEA